MAQDERKGQEEGVPKVLEDRIRPDAELVEDVLDPSRPKDRVRYPDPTAPGEDRADGTDTIAEMEMSRRTDAASWQPTTSGARGSVLPWLLGAAVLILIVAALALS